VSDWVELWGLVAAHGGYIVAVWSDSVVCVHHLHTLHTIPVHIENG